MLLQRSLFVVLSFLSLAVPVIAQTTSVIDPPPVYVNGRSTDKVAGLIPSQVRRAYGFDQITNEGQDQTIGIIVAFDHPRIEDDLAVFSKTFGLPACTTSNGCFEKVYASGTVPTPTPAELPFVDLFLLEHALDVEWAHAIAPKARIMLVESSGLSVDSLLEAVDVAVARGASVVSMSWQTRTEFPRQTTLDNHFVAANVSFVAAAGDTGHPASWPAASPFVTAVGGTMLHLDSKGKYVTETAWTDGGGGLSSIEVEPQYQVDFNIPNNPEGKRGIPDVAYHADINGVAPSMGFAVFTSIPAYNGWVQVGGTSAGAPQWGALLAIVNSMRVSNGKYPLQGSNTALYGAAKSGYSNNYNDITAGTNTNGQCGPQCSAGPGYDYVTGLGSPRANNLITALVALP
jgi:subtilase family serine protease